MRQPVQCKCLGLVPRTRTLITLRQKQVRRRRQRRGGDGGSSRLRAYPLPPPPTTSAVLTGALPQPALWFDNEMCPTARPVNNWTRAARRPLFTAVDAGCCSVLYTDPSGRFSPQRAFSVPAGLGNGQGAKEIIRHNLARERPKFGHNLVRKRHKIFHAWTTKIWSFGRLMKTWAQICKHFTSIFTSAVWKRKNSNYIL